MTAFQLFTWWWAGLITGVSFVATPAKFLAPTLQLANALDVGRATFSVMKWIEAILVILMVAAIFKLPLGQMTRLLCIALIVMISVQYLIVLPPLDARVSLIMQGQVPPPSALHYMYIALELSKVLTLAFIGYLAAQTTT